MDFQKNHFVQSTPTRLAGNKVLPNKNPFEISKSFLAKKRIENKEEQPITPEQRLIEQKNQRHFIHSDILKK